MEKEWFEKLTDAQKAKLRGLNGDAEKLIAFCREIRNAGKALPWW